MFDLPELIIMIIVILVILFGSQLPKLARHLITLSTKEKEPENTNSKKPTGNKAK